MAKGRAAAIIAGPPCETWSAVRYRAVPNVKKPPRPLRSREGPWGLPYLSQKEYNQLAIGNQLLRVTILFIYAAINYRVPIVTEHPSTVEVERQAPSSRPLAEIQHVITLAEVTMVHFHQMHVWTSICQANDPSLRTRTSGRGTYQPATQPMSMQPPRMIPPTRRATRQK